jgi:hypothetical protein
MLKENFIWSTKLVKVTDSTVLGGLLWGLKKKSAIADDHKRNTKPNMDFDVRILNGMRSAESNR